MFCAMAPEGLKEIVRHACRHTTTLQRWRITQNGEAVMIPIHSVLCANDGDVLRSAAINGRGVAILPTFLVGPDVEAGRLQIVLDRFPQPEFGVHALYASNRYLAAKTRAFVDFLAKRLAMSRHGTASAWRARRGEARGRPVSSGFARLRDRAPKNDEVRYENLDGFVPLIEGCRAHLDEALLRLRL